MSMSNWNDKTGGAKMTLSEAQKYVGSKSLRIEAGALSVKILTVTETDLPDHVNVELMSYQYNPDNCAIWVFFRYQDTSNFYCFSIVQTSTTLATIAFKYRSAGSWLGAEQQQNVSCPYRTWTKFKLMCCEISGTIYLLVYKEGVLIDTFSYNPGLWSGGGAVGVGVSAGSAGKYAYLDETKIYYTP